MRSVKFMLKFYMNITDPIFGNIEITEPLILSLINTKPFQRLKHINQYGGVNFIFKESYQTSRYEHSIGVWYATVLLGGNLEEQVAALLHDIGHTAFSHLVDQAKESVDENFHEFNQKKLEGYDEIQELLNKNNIQLKDVDEYKLIKTSLPDIGTDRLDYALRDFNCVMHYDDNFGAEVLNSIKIIDGEIVFENQETAKEFSLRANQAMYFVIYEPTIAVVYQSLIEILRDCIIDGWLTEPDLVGTDAEVFEIIQKNKNNLDNHNDWIVINTTMETLFEWSKADENLKSWLFPRLEKFENSDKKSIAGRAKKYLNYFSK